MAFGLIPFWQMDWRAICRRRKKRAASKELTEILSNAQKPRITGEVERRKRTREWIAHGQASAPASDLAWFLDEACSEREMRGAANSNGCPEI
jgi:hypothetical protein